MTGRSLLRSTRTTCAGGGLRVVGMSLLLLIAPAVAAQSLHYNRDIRPILADNCFDCHSADKHKAGLRLDLRESTTRPADSGDLPIVPGSPGKSALVQRITSTDASERMPPPQTEKRLTAEQVQRIERWIKEGAAYEGHWAFTPPARPALPPVTDQGHWCRNAIDRFVLAKLESEKLAPSSEADRAKLLRRLSLDLIGLPPTPQEVDAFIADTSADAYERQVERLLASPHYGERWGRVWLDGARYADSNGFQRDKFRSIWFYRDYVINALNRDLPYDQFITEQIAGDQLPHPTQDQIVATGFLCGNPYNDEGGDDPDKFRMTGLVDRMDVIGTGILGLTLQCAQCHSHKYDPITQTEYYRLLAFLNNDDEAQPIVYTPDERARIERLTREMGWIEADLKARSPDWQARMLEWEQQERQRRTGVDQPHWVVLPLECAENVGEHWYSTREDGSVFTEPSAPTDGTSATFTWTTTATRVTAFRLELLTDPNLPAGGPGRSLDGTCALSEFDVETAPAADPEHRSRVKFSSATADVKAARSALDPRFSGGRGDGRMVGPVEFAIDGRPETAWGIDVGAGRRNQDRTAVFVCAAPIVPAPASFPQPAGTIVTFHLRQAHGGANLDGLSNNNLGRFRISATSAEGPLTADPMPKRVRQVLAIRPNRRTAAHAAEIFSYWRGTRSEWKEANERIEALWQQWPAGTTTLALSSRPEPRETRVLIRGEFGRPGDAVTPGVPAFLHPLPPGEEPSRLLLARWLVDRRSPTTARAFVNRVWQAYFGTGIVETSEDLGTQCAAPSHAELLDWLAVEFMESNWSIKHLHRLIVMSAAYRQESRVTPELLARDPYNRWLARGPRFRVDAEAVRDIGLAASGLLNAKIGGRSVMPPAPAFLFKPPASFAPFPWVEETGDERYRRALYTFHRRSTPYPMLQAFDAPGGISSCTRRGRSNTPLQALTTLNEPVFVDCARALGRIAIEQGGASDRERLAYAFRRVLSRKPADEELADLTAALESARGRFERGELDAGKVVGEDQPAVGNVKASIRAAYVVVARVLLNLDETLTKQ